jgi:hypothetical protein
VRVLTWRSADIFASDDKGCWTLFVCLGVDVDELQLARLPGTGTRRRAGSGWAGWLAPAWVCQRAWISRSTSSLTKFRRLESRPLWHTWNLRTLNLDAVGCQQPDFFDLHDLVRAAVHDAREQRSGNVQNDPISLVTGRNFQFAGRRRRLLRNEPRTSAGRRAPPRPPPVAVAVALALNDPDCAQGELGSVPG